MNAPIDVTNIRMETPRLILRPWREDDLEDFFECASADGVGQMAGWMPHKTIDETWNILQMFIEQKKALALELKENGRVIGSLGIEKSPVAPEIPERLLGRELGYVLSREYWGRGLMPEAVSGVINYCFQTLEYDNLACAHFARNSQSRRVIEKTGFCFLKEIKHETRYSTVEDIFLYVQYNEKR